MASFDFVEASAKGYGFVWNQKSYLLQVAVPVIFVKVFCALSIFLLQLDSQPLQKGLILMPAIFIEGLFVARLVRYYLYGEHIHIWGKMVTPAIIEKPRDTYKGHLSPGKCVKAGLAMYALIQVIQFAIYGIVSQYASPAAPIEPPPPEQTIANAAMAFALLFGFVWVFRLIWLYVPAAMGISLTGFLNKIKGLKSSVFMIVMWLMCFVPLAILFTTFIGVMISPLGGLSAASIVMEAVLQSIAELLLIAVQVVAMTHAVKLMLQDT